MKAKKLWTSKTFWINLIALVAIILQVVMGKEAIPAEAQASLLAVINVILRLITNKPIEW